MLMVEWPYGLRIDNSENILLAGYGRSRTAIEVINSNNVLLGNIASAFRKRGGTSYILRETFGENENTISTKNFVTLFKRGDYQSAR